MKRLAAALAACVAFGAAAADWVIVSSGTRLATGEDFDLLVIAPEGESPPDALALSVRADLAEIVVTLRAEGPAAGQRRIYYGRLPEAAAGEVTLSLAGRPSNALLVSASRRRDAVHALTSGEEPPLSENDPMYFVVGTRGGNTARFQLSFKYRLFDVQSGFGRERPWLSGLYFGFTQNSIWDLSSRSKAFRDTSYRPSLFWKWERADAKTWLDAARFGLEHESNGRDDPRSRSIDIAFVRPEWHWALPEDERLEFTPKVYAYLDKDENPDIHRTRGYVDWRVRYDSGNLWIATAVLRQGSSGKGSILIDLSRRTRDLKLGPISGYLHAQFFAGYGEDILDYNVKRKSQLRLGFAIVP
ncbi:MAG: phospholipase A [Betaproteobacteria bacterium]